MPLHFSKPLLNNSSLELTKEQFKKIRRIIIEEETEVGIIPMISKNRHKFSLRTHSNTFDYSSYTSTTSYYVDFYSAHAKTMFLMKYSDVLG